MIFSLSAFSMGRSRRRILGIGDFAGISTAVLDTYSNALTLGAIAVTLGGIDWRSTVVLTVLKARLTVLSQSEDGNERGISAKPLRLLSYSTSPMVS